MDMNQNKNNNLILLMGKLSALAGKVSCCSKIKWVVLLEIIVFLGGALLLDYYYLDRDQFYYVNPHPFWALILLVSVLYGAGYGALAAVVASTVFLWGNIPEQALDQDMYSWFFTSYKLPILWLISSMVIGKIGSRYITTQKELTEKLDQYSHRQETLMQSLQHIKAAKEKMEIRVAGQRSTIHRVLTAARDVESLEPIQVLERAQGLVESMLEPEQFSIYLLKDECLQLMFENGWKEHNIYKQIFDKNDPLFKSIIESGNVLCIINPTDELTLEGHGVLASPLIVPRTGEVFGMLKIEKQSFSKLSYHTIKELKVVCDWIGSIYGKTSRHLDDRNIVSLTVARDNKN